MRFGVPGSVKEVSPLSIQIPRGGAARARPDECGMRSCAMIPRWHWPPLTLTSNGTGLTCRMGRSRTGSRRCRTTSARWAEMWQTWEVDLEGMIDAGEDRVIVFF